MGTGHIMRCLTLAYALKKICKVHIYFFTRKAPGNINYLIKKAGFNLIEMQIPRKVSNVPLAHSSWLGATENEDAQEFLQLGKAVGVDCFDCIITDHYAIDQIWQKQVKNHTKKILVIDDLGDRIHQCDCLLDQTYNCSADKYEHQVSDHCHLMLGTKFALLRDEFTEIYKQKSNKERNILVMFGATDANNLTLKTLQLLSQRTDINEINIIVGSSALHIKSVQAFIDEQSLKNFQNINLHINPNNIAQLMQNAYLAIGAAGTTSWERCASGLPAVVVIQAENQRQIAHQLQQAKVITYIEESEMTKLLNKRIDQWLNNDLNYEFAVTQAMNICDGLGSKRVAKNILNLITSQKVLNNNE